MAIFALGQNYFCSGLDRIKYFFLIILLSSNAVFSQTQECLALLLEFKYNEAALCAEETKENTQLRQLIDILKYKSLKNPTFQATKNTSQELIIIDSITKGYYLLYKDTKQINKPFDLFNYALSKSQEIENTCLLYTSPSPRDRTRSRMPSSA